MRYRRLCLYLFSAIFFCTACMNQPQSAEPDPETNSTATPGAVDNWQVETIAENLQAPWAVAFYDETPIVSERDTSRILEITDDGGIRELTVVEQTAESTEGGLLGLAVHEDALYAYLTTAEDNRIHRYELTGGSEGLELSDPEVIFDGIPAASHHNGGRLAFGPDGLLYISTGDGLEPSTAQDQDSLAGKILRLNSTGDIPADNPFDDSPVFSYGHRNVQGLAWAPDGTMYASEFGEDTWDELNIIVPGGNFGWPYAEGVSADESFIDPIQQWPPSEASPSGIAIADEHIYMTALRGQRLWEIPVEDPGTSVPHFDDDYGRLRDVITGPDGALWLLTNNTDGRGDPATTDDRLLRLTRN